MTRQLLAVFLAAVLSGSAFADAGANLFTNANFDDSEGSAVTGWNVGPGISLSKGGGFIIASDYIVSKPYVININGDNGNGSVKQTVTVPELGRYEIGFNFSSGTLWGRRHDMQIFLDGYAKTGRIRAGSGSTEWKTLAVTNDLVPGSYEACFDFIRVANLAFMAVDDTFFRKIEDLKGMLLVSGEPRVFSVDGTPVYGFHQLETGVATNFTCPAHIDLDDAGTCYANCTGYRVDTYDTSSQTWTLGTPVAGATSYSITRADDANRRLVWLFEQVYYFNPTHIWNGNAGDGEFSNKANWATITGAAVTDAPGHTSTVYIPAPESEEKSLTVTVSKPIDVAGFYAGRLGSSKGALTIVIAHGGVNTVAGDCTFFPGVTLVGPNLFTNANFDDSAGLAATGWIAGGNASLSSGSSFIIGADYFVSKPNVVQMVNDSSVKQTVTVPKLGRYEIGFIFSSGTLWGRRHDMQIFLDGDAKTEKIRAGSGTTEWKTLAVTNDLVPGSHEACFDFIRVADNAFMAVDDAFFRKIDDLKGMLLVSGEPKAFSVDGAPVYGFHQLETGVATNFTCPARIDLDDAGTCYVRCTGYRVDTYDTSSQTWTLGTPVAGATSYSITRADDENRRLAWQFEQVYYFNPTHIWNGNAGDGEFANKANWETLTGEAVTDAPGHTSTVYIPAPEGEVESLTVTVSEPIDVAGFYAGRLGTSKGALTIMIAHGGANTVVGDCTLFPGVTLTHPEQTVTTFSDVGYRVNFNVGGNMTVASGSSVDVSACGFAKQTPSGQGGTDRSDRSGASHGGRTRMSSDGHAVNDSVHFPTNFGPGGFWYRGGGAIRLTVTGTLTANGDLKADADQTKNELSGAGGALWLTVGTLAGGGALTANGANKGGSSGSGGRIAVHQTAATDFSAFTGAFQCRCVGSANTRAPGTIYLRCADEALDEGTLLVENGGATTAYGRGAEITESEFAFGTVIVTNGARLFVRGDQTLHIRDRLCTLGGGVITNEAGFEMDFSLSTNLLFQGTNLFARFTYTNKTGTLRFGTEAGSQFGTHDGGAMLIRGDGTSQPRLLPNQPTEFWRMHLGVGSDALSVFRNIAVSNSLASGGESVSAVDSTDLGGNDSFWSFIREVTPGDPIVWNGSVDTDWTNGGNWTDKYGAHRTPQGTDCITIAREYDGQAVSHFPTLSAGVTDVHALAIGAGATLTLDGGDLRCDVSLAVTGTLACAGSETVVVSNALDVAGTFRLATATVTCHGPVNVTGRLETEGRALVYFRDDVTLVANAVSAPLATFRLTGSEDQSVTPAGNGFFVFEVAKTGGRVTFADGFTADALKLGTTESAATLTFASGSTVVCSDFFASGTLDDAAGLSLLASGDEAWLLRATGDCRVASGVAVTNCDARAGGAIRADALSQGKDAQGWLFGETVSYWTGAVNSSWKNAANWASGAVPASGADVYVSAARTDRTVTLDAAATLNRLVFRTDGQAVLTFAASAELTLAETLDVPANVTLSANKPILTQGDFIVRAGATLTHDGPGNSQTSAVDVTAKGAITLESGAVVSVDGKGYTGGKGPGGGGGDAGPVAVHAGWTDIWSSYHVPYGSILYPVTWGSGGISWGASYAGGGAIRLTTDGVLTLGCSVSANALDTSWSAAGGSVFLTCAKLVGGGNVTACGGKSSYPYSGSGGRIALVQTAAADFLAWTGAADAGNKGSTSTRGGPGTIYMKSAEGAAMIEIANEVYKANSYTDFPMADDGDAKKVYRNTALVVSSNATVNLTADAKVRDLDLVRATSYIRLNGHTLTVLMPMHKNGRNWGANYSALVTEDGGKIVWRSGTALKLR